MERREEQEEEDEEERNEVQQRREVSEVVGVSILAISIELASVPHQVVMVEARRREDSKKKKKRVRALKERRGVAVVMKRAS